MLRGDNVESGVWWVVFVKSGRRGRIVGFIRVRWDMLKVVLDLGGGGCGKG